MSDGAGEDVRALLDRAAAPPIAPGELRILTLPAPAGAAERILRLLPDEPAFFWSSADGLTVAGAGAAAVVRSAGSGRFARVRDAAAALWPRIRVTAAPDVAPVRPRLFGGFSFLAADPPGDWAAFGQATFVLPRIAYVEDGDGARLAVVVERGGEGARRLVERALAALAEGDDDAAVPPPSGPAAPADDGPAWADAVASIRAEIAAGRAEKIVVARARDLAVGDTRADGVLRRLDGDGAEARFAFRLGAATFVGATPERLVALRGGEVRTEALAGSIRADGADRAAELLASRKDATEHAYVVRAIAGAIGPLCARLDHPPEPGVRRLRHVLHLHTPFTGRLAAPAHVLDLVARLHPTPAVGGTPTAAALDWIAAREPGTRGWYAAPVGWFDERGDGDFVVALRSALLARGRARLYAGAGIVADSDPAAELAETEVKLRTMAEALGCAT